MNELTFLLYCLMTISMSFLRVRLFGTYEDRGARRHSRGRTRPRTKRNAPHSQAPSTEARGTLRGPEGTSWKRAWHRHAA